MQVTMTDSTIHITGVSKRVRQAFIYILSACSSDGQPTTGRNLFKARETESQLTIDIDEKLSTMSIMKKALRHALAEARRKLS